MGVFTQPWVDSAGVVVYIHPGDIQKRLLGMLTLPGNTKSQTRQYNLSSPVYDAKFKYDASSVTVSVMNDSTEFNPAGVRLRRSGYLSGIALAIASTTSVHLFLVWLSNSGISKIKTAGP